MNEIEEIKRLEQELQEKKANLQNKQANCNHEWSEVKYDPEEVLQQYCTGGYVLNSNGTVIMPEVDNDRLFHYTVLDVK